MYHDPFFESGRRKQNYKVDARRFRDPECEIGILLKGAPIHTNNIGSDSSSCVMGSATESELRPPLDSNGQAGQANNHQSVHSKPRPIAMRHNYSESTLQYHGQWDVPSVSGFPLLKGREPPRLRLQVRAKNGCWLQRCSAVLQPWPICGVQPGLGTQQYSVLVPQNGECTPVYCIVRSGVLCTFIHLTGYTSA